LLEHLSLASNVGRGFRAPSIYELHVDGVHGGVAAYQVGNPHLRPELSLNTDLSVRWRSERLKVKATGYRQAIDQYIYGVNTGQRYQQTGPVMMRIIQGDAVLWGAYTDVRAQLKSWLHVRGGAEWVKGTNVDTHQELPLLPAPKANAELRYTREQLGPLEQFYVRAGVRHAFRKEAAGRYEPFWQFGNSRQFPFGVASTDAYTLVDAGIGFHVPVYDQHVHFHLAVHNLLNTPYRDFLDTYKGYALSPGRDITLKMKVPFEIVKKQQE
jgi:iron complex outermembrane receptor protein/hemoglobin/transferrin/lactoferrin receptor protein